MNPRPLQGRSALITGGNKGLGQAIATALAEAGARVWLVARGGLELETAARALRSGGAEVETSVTDIADEPAVQTLADTVRARWGAVDILVNNAGVNVRKPVTDFTLEEWRRVLDTNVTGAFLMCRAFVPAMKGRGYGRILNLTSILSHVGMGGRTAYAASKTALLGFTRALALELAADAITVNGISPGPVATEMNLPLLENHEVRASFTSRIPLGRWGKVEEIGQLARFLCSEEAAFITGTDILIDGGWCAQ